MGRPRVDARSLPQNQPACLTDATTGLVDCGNWAVSASWAVPADAVSGVYIAQLVRTDTGGESQIPFVVRNDASHSDLVFQTSDTTWQAYNDWGGASLYTAAPAGGRAYKVSYNRPFVTRADTPTAATSSSATEYPMVRFLEPNGYDVSYQSGVDTDRCGALLLNHKTFLSVGHDEYWSGNQRANVEAARDAGREPRVLQRQRGLLEDPLGADASTARPPPYRTLVCLQGDQGQRQDRPDRRSGPAPGATRASARRPTAAAPRTP